MRLIAEWRRCHTFYSVQLASVIALLGFLQASLLPLWEAQLSPGAYATLNSFLATLLFVVRLIRQEPKRRTRS